VSESVNLHKIAYEMMKIVWYVTAFAVLKLPTPKRF